jgi:hypothetical protein
MLTCEKKLVATVKSSLEDGDVIKCKIFLLDDIDLVGKIIEQHRHTDEEQIVGKFIVLESSKPELVVRRIDGSLSLDMCDSLYVQLEDEVSQPISTKVNAYSFNGKNWKLASIKKWKPCKIDRPNSECIGIVNLHTSCKVFKTDDGFVAISE